MAPLTILLIHNFYRARGGEDEHVLYLENLLKEKGHAVYTYYQNSNSINQMSLIQKIFLPFTIFFAPRIRREIIECVRKVKPDVVHIHNILPLISFNIYRWLNVPIVQSVDNFRLMCLNGLFLLNNGKVCERCSKGNFLFGVMNRCYKNNWIKSAWMASVLWFQQHMINVLSRADGFACPTQFVADKLKRVGCPPEKLFVIPYFLSDSNAPQHGSSSEPYVLYVGRLSAEKGINTLLRAFESLTNVRLKIVGNGPLQRTVEDFIRERQLGHIELLGYVDAETKEELIRKAHLMIFPSECYETFGLSILESFQAGVPVVTTNLGSRNELVQDDYNGKFYRAGDLSHLKEIVQGLMKNHEKWNRMRHAAYETFRIKFSREAAYEKMIHCYKAVCNLKERAV